MFFLPKCYKPLEKESSLLKNSGWCEENLKKKIDSFLPIYKRKKEKNSFSIHLKTYNFSHHYPLLVFNNRICNRLTSVVLGSID